MSDIKSLLEKLSNAHGTSGWEGSVSQIVEEEISPYVDEIRVDSMGNLIATKKGDRPSILLDAHVDEIGLMVKYVDDRGFINFIKLGGWFDQTLLNQRVILHTRSGKVFGVIGSKAPHAMNEEERKKMIEAKNMFIDIGCQSREEVEKEGIIPGTPVTIDRNFSVLKGDRATGKAFDNRAGIVMMIEALKRTKSKSTIYAVGSVQEEVGLKGARTSSYGLNPDLAVALDVTIPGDYPGFEKKDGPLEIGKGPVVTIADASGRGILVTPQVLEWMVGTAKEFEIAIQLDVDDFGGTTAGSAIQLTKAGIPTGVLSVATRYIHSPVEVLSLSDIENGAELMARAMETLPKYFKNLS